MSGAAHTPGPWRLSKVGNIVREGNGTQKLLVCKISRSPSPENSANARLIAAAPDLLALAFQYKSDLLHPITDSGSRQRRLEAIEAALAKVNGVSAPTFELTPRLEGKDARHG